MAIILKDTVDPDNELPLVFNNGDLAALKSAVERLGFKDEVNLLRYVLAVISKSATRTLTVIDTDGKSIALNPNPSLLTTPAVVPTAPPVAPAPDAPPVSGETK